MVTTEGFLKLFVNEMNVTLKGHKVSSDMAKASIHTVLNDPKL